jgi:hypothetical protein
MRKRLLYYLKAFLLIVALLAGCSLAMTLAIDSMCYNVLSQRLPLYPDAHITFERYSFLRRYGMGGTLLILDSDDSPDVVQAWYGRESGQAAREAQQRGVLRGFYGFARADWSVARAEDGTGSQIILSGACAAG